VSQRHAGWVALANMYDDGGLSGGTMERPALKRLLEDIKAGKVQIVVVYKVDRLTRSLADFAKIVDVLDAHNASFVSVTQQFNTTTSMGPHCQFPGPSTETPQARWLKNRLDFCRKGRIAMGAGRWTWPPGETLGARLAMCGALGRASVNSGAANQRSSNDVDPFHKIPEHEERRT
jgi:Resolvase, N terminal domain